MRKILFFLCILTLTIPAAAGGSRERESNAADAEGSAAAAFINLLKAEGKLPADPAWADKLKAEVQNQLRRGEFHPAAISVVAENFPVQTDESDPASAGSLAGRLLEDADESLRKGASTVKVRNKIRSSVARSRKLPPEEVPQARSGHREIENRGRRGGGVFDQPGLENKPDNPGEIPPDIPTGQGDGENGRQDNEPPGR